MFDPKLLANILTAFARRGYKKCKCPFKKTVVFLPVSYYTRKGVILRKPDKPLWLKSTRASVKFALVTCSDETGANQSLQIAMFDWKNDGVEQVAELSKINGKQWEKKFTLPKTTVDPVKFEIVIKALVDVFNCVNRACTDF